MPPKIYNWVPDDLVEVADEIDSWMAGRGYSLKTEVTAPGFPFPPTFLCTRNRLERVVIEVMPGWQDGRLSTWIDYAKSCRSELKVCIGLRHDAQLSLATMARVRNLGVGVIRSGNANTYFEIEPADASMNVSLPSRLSLPVESRALLGAAYDHFEASRWREGFEEACKVFEKAAKRYLKKWVKTGRVRFVTKSGTEIKTPTQINGLTLGGLGKLFERIQAQNASDRQIRLAINSILKDRNNLTHNKWNLRTEKRLRGNVAHHMWVITQALSQTL